MKVHLVDGTYELFRAYYGAPPAQAADGREVGATRGLMRSLLALINGGATHVACAFDSVVESFRNDLFDGYKTGEGIETELFAQFPLAEEATRALGITVWPMMEFEADDALASGAERFRHEVDQVVICSPDKDLTQCVLGDRVVAYDRKQDRTLDEQGVIDRFGVPPTSIPDYLALVGDSADGIPGVARWGAKGTAAVLARYLHLESIPADHADWDVTVRGGKRLSEELEAARDDALLYRTLATLRRDVPLPEDLDALEWKGADRNLHRFCEQIGERTLPGRVPRWHA